MAALIILYTLPALMLTAAITDITRFVIPNWIALAVVGCFLVAGPLSGLDVAAMGVHVLVGAIALAVGFTLFFVGILGGGDAKLIAAGALWFGPAGVLPYALAIAISGGVLCLLLLAYRAIPSPMTSAGWLRTLHDPSSGVPYGVAIATGAVMALPTTGWMALAYSA